MSWLKQVILLLTITVAALAFLIHIAPIQAATIAMEVVV